MTNENTFYEIINYGYHENETLNIGWKFDRKRKEKIVVLSNAPGTFMQKLYNYLDTSSLLSGFYPYEVAIVPKLA